MGAPKLWDMDTLVALGLTEHKGDPFWYKNAIKKNLRDLDLIQATNRYKWLNLPDGLTSELMERMLYYRGQIMFFYSEELDKFMALPFVMQSKNGASLDVYGRPQSVAPLPFNGMAQVDDKEKVWIPGLVKTPVYEIALENTWDQYTDSCVIIYDRTKQISNRVLSRQSLIDPLLEAEADLLPYCKTALMNSTGVRAVRVNAPDEVANAEAMSLKMDVAALTQQNILAILGGLDFQDLAGGNVANAEEFLLAFESFDKFRQSIHGITNDGVFEKQAYRNNAQTQMSGQSTSLIYDDGLKLRQDACDLINSVWGIGIDCIPNEQLTCSDFDGNGYIGEDNDTSGTMPGEQPTPTEVEEDA